MKDDPPKYLPRGREASPESNRLIHSPSTSHKQLEILKEPKVELYRSSSGRNIRLKHLPPTTAVLSPHGRTPRAPERKRPPEPPPKPHRQRSLSEHSGNSPKHDTHETRSVDMAFIRDNQMGSATKQSIQSSRSGDRRSSFSISEDILQQLGYTRTQTPDPFESPRHENNEEEELEGKPAALHDAKKPEDRAVYQFDLWKKAGKNRTLADAITVQKDAKSPAKPPRRESDGDMIYDLAFESKERQQYLQDEGESMWKPQIRVREVQNGSRRICESRDVSLTKSTSPTIGDRSRSSSRIAPIPSPGSDPGIVNWKRGELIGEGTFGRVYKGMNKETGELYAVKEIEIRSAADTDQMKQLQKLGEEIALMHNLSHKHIVRYKGSQRTDRHFYIFMEYVPGGSIASMLKQFDAFDEDLIRKFTRQIVEGVAYLHEMGIIHRDIKGANVLVNELGVSKLADFGCSKQLPEIITISLQESLRSIRGSVPWMAPEVVRQTGHGFKADIWSIGATVIEMATGRHPWPDTTNHLAAMYTIATAKSSPPIPTRLSPLARSFLERCFCIDPEDRASAQELSHHAFLRG
ncbi:hypothetical protein Poli38472_007056 [Pythium oligandrum]|uniref:Protein kinase domain-containing protein n=1 Tax=Pythium oligandrum TaxID=41045 RepID=A0A8K1C909_PYTOL|nr:hypothetical protein Poli38472_007056 [Pythium oligandrum]|eukprot:TMW58911.1 hypothetical protein Poli38472_007056 [Pythium oligandrum]